MKTKTNKTRVAAVMLLALALSGAIVSGSSVSHAFTISHHNPMITTHPVAPSANTEETKSTEAPKPEISIRFKPGELGKTSPIFPIPSEKPADLSILFNDACD